MVLYDTVLYIICCGAFFGFQPSIVTELDEVTTVVYPVAGYLLFFGFRFLLKCYKQIWRYGSAQSILKDTLAGVSGGLSLLLLSLLLGKLLHIAPIPFAFLVSFAAVYILLTMAMRIFYWQLYHFASKDTKLSRVVRLLLAHCALVDFESKKPGATLRLVLEPDNRSAGPINELQRVTEQFAIRGDVTSIVQINKGYINRTYKVETLSDT